MNLWVSHISIEIHLRLSSPTVFVCPTAMISMPYTVPTLYPPPACLTSLFKFCFMTIAFTLFYSSCTACLPTWRGYISFVSGRKLVVIVVVRKHCVSIPRRISFCVSQRSLISNWNGWKLINRCLLIQSYIMRTFSISKSIIFNAFTRYSHSGFTRFYVLQATFELVWHSIPEVTPKWPWKEKNYWPLPSVRLRACCCLRFFCNYELQYVRAGYAVRIVACKPSRFQVWISFEQFSTVQHYNIWGIRRGLRVIGTKCHVQLRRHAAGCTKWYDPTLPRTISGCYLSVSLIVFMSILPYKFPREQYVE